MNNTNIQALIESFKQLMRTLIFVILGWLMSDKVIALILDAVFGNRVDAAIKIQIAAVIALLLQSIDKFLHQSDIKVNGLLPQTPIT